MQTRGRANIQAGRDIVFSPAPDRSRCNHPDNNIRTPHIIKLQAVQIALQIVIAILCTILLINENILRHDIYKMNQASKRTEIVFETMHRH
ncbi:MAG: hypothetical protein WBB19_02020 [Desulforhopalus sp.]